MRLLAIGVMCTLPLAMVVTLLQGLPWNLPNWTNKAMNDLGGWMLIAGFLSLVLTPITLAVGAWSIFKSKLDKRIRVAIACFLSAQIAAVLILLVAAYMSGGRLPH